MRVADEIPKPHKFLRLILCNSEYEQAFAEHQRRNTISISIKFNRNGNVYQNRGLLNAKNSNESYKLERIARHNDVNE